MENTDIVLEGSTATWKMPNIEGELGGTYTGTFVFRTFLDPLTRIQAGKELRALLGDLGAHASDEEVHLAYALVQLKHRIVKSPPFWSSTLQESGMAGNIGDVNVISVVLSASTLAESLFKEKIAIEREELLNRNIKIVEDLMQQKAKRE